MKRTLTALASVSGLLLVTIVLLGLSSSDGSAGASHAAAGEVLSPVALQPNERIEIDYSSEGCRSNGNNWTFVLFGGPERRLAVIDAGGSFTYPTTGRSSPSPIGAIALSERDCVGLFDLLQHYRHPDPQEMSTTTVNIRVSYFRGSSRVGAERFVEHGLVDNWVYARDYGELTPAISGATMEMVSLRQLALRAAQANQPAEPTLAIATPF